MPPDTQPNEMAAIQKPTAAPQTQKAAKEEKLSQGRRAQVAAALNLVPKNATQTLGGDADFDDGTEIDPIPASGAALAAPAAPVTAGAPALGAPAPQAAAPQASTAQPSDPTAPKPPETPQNPWDVVTRLDADNLALKKQLKAVSDQLSKFNQAPVAPTPGSVLSVEDLAKDPFGALKKAGISYQDLTQRMLEGGGPTVNDALAEATRAREAALAEVQAVRGEVQTLRNGLTRERLELGFHKTIQTDPRFDLLSADPESAVTESISELARHYQETGERLPDSAVLATVQRKWSDRLKKLDSNQAARKHLGLQSGSPAPAAQPVAAPQTSGSNASPANPASAAIPPQTLTNDMSVSSPRVESGSIPSGSMNRRNLIRETAKRLVPPNPFGEDDE